MRREKSDTVIAVFGRNSRRKPGVVVDWMDYYGQGGLLVRSNGEQGVVEFVLLRMMTQSRKSPSVVVMSACVKADGGHFATLSAMKFL